MLWSKELSGIPLYIWCPKYEILLQFNSNLSLFIVRPAFFNLLKICAIFFPLFPLSYMNIFFTSSYRTFWIYFWKRWPEVIILNGKRVQFSKPIGVLIAVISLNFIVYLYFVTDEISGKPCQIISVLLIHDLPFLC